jgi:imidazole glycerol-phosphate synthase subunit HisH
MGTTAILDYDAGNLTSVERAVRFLGFDGRVTRDPAAVRDAERVIFPGVGAARASMDSIRRLGLEEELRRAVERGCPVLGICIGCQVIFEESEEDGGTACLGLLPGRVVRFPFDAASGVKVPHMGWNEVRIEGRHPVFADLDPEGAGRPQQFYFVHGYYPQPSAPELVLGTCEYGGIEFAAAVGRGNLVAVQFHVEKSGRPGLRLLENFLRWRP